MTAHPLLTKVLTTALDVSLPEPNPDRLHEMALDITDAIPPDIADRLEWALDVCTCGVQRVSYVHLRTSGPDHHPYQPLVQP